MLNIGKKFIDSFNSIHVISNIDGCVAYVEVFFNDILKEKYSTLLEDGFFVDKNLIENLKEINSEI